MRLQKGISFVVDIILQNLLAQLFLGTAKPVVGTRFFLSFFFFSNFQHLTLSACSDQQLSECFFFYCFSCDFYKPGFQLKAVK